MDTQDIINYIREAVEMKNQLCGHETTTRDRANIDRFIDGLEQLAIAVDSVKR